MQVRDIIPKELFLKTGIYSIKTKHNNKYYFGSTGDKKGFYKRWDTHLRKLRNNEHPNKKLQSVFNKYGEENFEFKIRVICKPEHCLKLEQIYLDNCLSAQEDIKIFWKMGYNLSPTAGNNLRFKYKKYQRLNISKALKGKSNKSKGVPKPYMQGENHFFWGKKRLIEHRLNLGKPVIQYDLKGNFIKYWDSPSFVEEELNINSNSISAVCRGNEQSAGGFMWKRYKKGKDYTQSIKPYKRTWAKGKEPVKIVQYDENGEFIRIFNTSTEVIKFNFDCSSVIKCCKFKLIHFKNNQFRYYSENYKENIGSIYSKKRNKKYAQYSKEGELIKIWNNRKELKSIGISTSMICAHLKGKVKTVKNFIIKEYED
jgi:group I intron endonuclease